MATDGDNSDIEGDAIADKMSIEDEKDNFFMAVKYGLKKQLVSLLDKNRAFVDSVDSDGNYAAHWAAKSGNAETLQILRERGANLGIVAQSSSGMTPLHWAASDGKISCLRYLLDCGLNPDCRDAAGCTPLVIAAQHEELYTVIFLVQYGVDVSAVDFNGDTALHWGAYKGHLEIVGYLSYAMERYVGLADRYGQTALHLATLRGNQAVVEYLVKECKQSCLVKDSNGLTCIDLAVSKQKFGIEWFLRMHVGPTLFHVASGMGWGRFCSCEIFKIVACGHTAEEAGAWAWRVVFFSNLVASVISLQYMQTPELADLVLSKYCAMIFQCMWWFCFLGCWIFGPGDVVETHDAQNKTNYDRALDLVLTKDGEIGDIKLCHSCHVQRPLRSKHDKFHRKCVHKFDHHCPFVGNTVGRDNHRFFIGLMIFHQLCFIGFLYASIIYGYRVEMSWFTIIFLCYAGFWDMMMVGLGTYHLQLISTNMTTNESMGAAKYGYFRGENGEFDNPFCRGNGWANVFDTLAPYKQQFYSRLEVLAFINRVGPMVGRAPGQCCGGGHDHSHGHAHGHGDQQQQQLTASTSSQEDSAPLLGKADCDV